MAGNWFNGGNWSGLPANPSIPNILVDCATAIFERYDKLDYLNLLTPPTFLTQNGYKTQPVLADYEGASNDQIASYTGSITAGIGVCLGDFNWRKASDIDIGYAPPVGWPSSPDYRCDLSFYELLRDTIGGMIVIDVAYSFPRDFPLFGSTIYAPHFLDEVKRKHSDSNNGDTNPQTEWDEMRNHGSEHSWSPPGEDVLQIRFDGSRDQFDVNHHEFRLFLDPAWFVLDLSELQVTGILLRVQQRFRRHGLLYTDLSNFYGAPPTIQAKLKTEGGSTIRTETLILNPSLNVIFAVELKNYLTIGAVNKLYWEWVLPSSVPFYYTGPDVFLPAGAFDMQIIASGPFNNIPDWDVIINVENIVGYGPVS